MRWSSFVYVVLAVLLVTSCRHFSPPSWPEPFRHGPAHRAPAERRQAASEPHAEPPRSHAAERPPPRPLKVEETALPTEPSTFRFGVEPSATAVQTAGGTVFLRVRLAAPHVTPVSRSPLNLAVVVDRSGSMDQEEKIGYLRQAIHLLVDQLLPTDRIAVVAFNQESHLLVPSHEVINREYLHHRVDELLAEGWTNLSAGLLEGYAQVEAGARQGGAPGHVIVLTDGLANRGVTDPGRLAKLVRDKRLQGLTLSTQGLGTEFDENLLLRLASAGGGRYVYMRRPEQIPGALQGELGALLEVFAQNVRLKVEVDGGGELHRVHGMVVEDPLEDVDTISLGDMAMGDERGLLLELQFPPAAAGFRFEAKCSVVYDLALSGERVTEERLVTVESSTRPAPPDRKVATYARLVLAIDRIHQAVEGMDEGLARASLRVLEEVYPQLKEVAFASGDQDLVNKAFLFHHFATELQEVVDAGLLHGHSEEREHLKKDLHYRRFLLQHHREGKH